MKRVLTISLVFNVMLSVTIAYIGVHTSFFQNVASRLGWIENEEVTNQKAVDCLRGWTKSLESIHDTLDVVFLGDSITYGGDFDLAFPTSKVCNLGYPSDDLKGMRARVSQVKALHPKKVVIMGGLNGLAQMGMFEFKNQYEVLLRDLSYACPGTRLLVLSILPVNETIWGHPLCPNDKIAQANEIIKELAEFYSLSFLDLSELYLKDGVLNKGYTSDGVHLKKEAYSIWYDAIRKYME